MRRWRYAAALGLAFVIAVGFLLLRDRPDPEDGLAPGSPGASEDRDPAAEGAAAGGARADPDSASGAGRGSAGAVTIEVRDRDGVPVPGARVAVWRGEETEFSHWDALARCAADAEGRASLPRPDAAPPFVLSIRPPRDRTDLLRTVLRGWRPGDPVPPVFRSFSVTGTVVDPDDRPIPGANVFCRAEGYDGEGAIADPKGRFRIDGLREGPVTLIALPETYGLTPASGEAVEVRAGQEDVRVLLRPDCEITIRLRPWRSEWPVSGTIWTEGLRGTRNAGRVVFRDGVARVVGIRPHLRYAIRLREPYLGLCPLFADLPGNVPDQTVHLGPGLDITGALDTPGTPIRAEVRAFHSHPFAGRFVSRGELRKDGTFRIGGLYRATWTVRAEAVYPDERRFEACAEVEAGGTVHLRLLAPEEFERQQVEKHRIRSAGQEARERQRRRREAEEGQAGVR